MGGSSNPTTTQTVETKLGPEQQQLFDAIWPGMKSTVAQGLQTYQGPTVAGFDPLQTQAQAGAIGAIPQGTALGTAGAGALSTLLDPSMLNIAQNPNFQGLAGSITNLANRNLLQNILPAITSGSTVAGGQYAGGGTRGDLAIGKGIGDTAIGTNSAISQLAASMYGQGLGAMTSAAGQVPMMQAAQLFGPEVMSAIGGQRQNLTQQQMNDAMSRFYGQEMMPWMTNEMAMSMLAGMPGASSTTTTHGATPQMSPLQMGLGGMAGVGAMAPFLNWMFPTGAGATSGLSGLGAGLSGLGSSIWGGLSGIGGSLAEFLPFLALA
jgi:hypothetical protein